MSPKQRRAQGAHYTTEKNILKVIEPLFLDDLRAELARIKRLRRDRAAALRAFQARLAEMTFFDPACGCGNFLVIAYRELREIELEVLTMLHSADQIDLNATSLSRVDVDQFYGIEIDEFPSLIAQVAMWMMDHIMNNRLSLKFGTVFARIPLKAAPHVTHGDALEIEWSSVLPPENCSFMMGNPPFVGAKMQTELQRGQVRRIANLGGSGGRLDYVTAWFLKAGEYLQESHARVGFVATNSITQGEQVAQLWPLLFDTYNLEIAFAHRTFAWGSDARGRAHVHVVIIGLARRGEEPAEKRLFTYDGGTDDATEARYHVLSPYLFDASMLTNPHIVVREASHALGGAPKVIIGTKPIDGGYYIFDAEERAAFLRNEPRAEDLLHPFVGAEEYINGSQRWILVLDGVAPERIRSLPAVYERVQLVRRYRRGEIAAKGKPTGTLRKTGTSAHQLADTPTRFHVTVIPKEPFLCIPEVSSERREYIPIGWLEPPTVPSNLVRVILDAELWRFGVLTSRMHRRQAFDSDRSRVEHLFGLYETVTQGLFATPGRRRVRARR
jgi:hypothetical protein